MVAASTPAKSPAVIVISPDILAAEAVICPIEFNIKASFVDFIWAESISNPPIDADMNLAYPSAFIVAFTPEPSEGVEILLADKSPCIVTSAVITPPSNKKFDPVIPPSAFNTSSPLELEITLEPISKPPILPASAVIVPDITTSPSGCKWKLDELISMLPFEPLKNCESLPKKNADELTYTSVPSHSILPWPGLPALKFPFPSK